MNMYQQNFQPNTYIPQYQARPPATNNGIIWVQGIEGAKAFQMCPNSNAMLLDSEGDRFYIKSADNVGMCNLRIFDYTEVTDTAKQEQVSIDTSQFVTREEFNKLLEELGGAHIGKQSISKSSTAKSTSAN